MTEVAWIGLGAMGSRMAARLRDAGHELVVWNRTREKAEELGVAIAASPRDAAEPAEFVFTMLTDPEALRAVTEGDDGLPAGLGEGAVLVEMSTVGPEAIAQLSEQMPAGTSLLDVPVLGSLPQAESGTLKLFAGGDDASFERARPLLEALGEPLRTGPLGSGAAAKLVANATLVGAVALLGETLALADAVGLPRETTWEVLAATPLGAQAERRRPAVESGEYPPRFRLSLARKDADLVQAAGADVGLDLPALDAARAHLTAAEVAGFGDEDYSAVLKHILG
ncbi:MAG TPA: NAD(P)-dependent oxidoreductase [Gaiellaceae bacterium]|nr:NAD(P)-dependent oxidoreductase [Gaiellaceae bacterium]